MTNTELTKIRESLNLTKSEFAKALGITPMMVGRCEKGSCAISEKIMEAVNALVEEISKPAPVVEEISTPAPVEKPAPKKRGRKKKETVTAVVAEKPAEEIATPVVEEKPAQKKVRARKKSTTPEVIVESLMGGQISVTDILGRLPSGVEKVYVKPEENKAYFIINNTHSIDLW